MQHKPPHASPRFKNVPEKAQNEYFANETDLGEDQINPEEVTVETPHFMLHGPDREALEIEYDKRVYDKVIKFTREAAEEIRGELSHQLSLIEFTSDPDRKRDFLRYIQEHNLDYPEFTYLVGMEALDHLFDIGLYDAARYNDKKHGIDKGEPFNTLIFKLPKPLDQFWKKDISEKEDGAIDVGAKIIPWGHIYRQVIPVLWKLRDEYEESGELNLDRINEFGDHKIGEYYYAWVGKVSNNESL